MNTLAVNTLAVRPTETTDEDSARSRRFREAALPHLDAVYTLARYLLRDPSDADDAGAGMLSPGAAPFRYAPMPGRQAVAPRYPAQRLPRRIWTAITSDVVRRQRGAGKA
jgi:hypothetical protein